MRQSGFANRSDATDQGVAAHSVQSDVILQFTFQDTRFAEMRRLHGVGLGETHLDFMKNRG